MSSNIRITRICQHCGNEFTAQTTTTKYCSHLCTSRAYKLRQKQAKIAESDFETQKQREKPLVALNALDYLTPKEAATLLKCDPRTIYAMINSGRLKAINLSVRKTRILKEEINNIFKDPTFHIIPKPKVFVEPTSLTLDQCYTIGQIQTIYKISDHTVDRIIKRYNIVKYRKGREVYVGKEIIDKILKKRVKKN